MVWTLFPWLNSVLRSIPDPRRDHPSKKYPLELLLWTVMLMFITQAGSRRQYDLDKRTDAFLQNLLLLAGVAGTGSVPRAETADDLLQKLATEILRGIRGRAVRSLMRGKKLEACRFNGLWVLVVDGTGLYSFKRRHCPHCLTRRNSKTGEVTYHHHVLELKLVSPGGLAISLESEFIENRDGEAKQDCELKAFYRAAKRLKQEWPLTVFLLLGDGIYANAGVMRLCKKLGWEYCFTLKNNLPSLKADAEAALAGAVPLTRIPAAGVERSLRWARGLSHAGIRCHALSCAETVTAADGSAAAASFLWVTSLLPSEKNAAALADVCRLRWKIENQGFKTQKCDGYNIEHGYGVTGHAWQNYYLLLQIVHIITQMATLTDAIHKLPSRREAQKPGRPPPLLRIFHSLKNFFKRLAEAFRYCPPSWRSLAELGKFQLRFLNST